MSNALEPAASRAWLLLALVLGAGALLGLGVDASRLSWEHKAAWAEPWRWWTAAWVHWSHRHVWANLAGLALVALLGWRAGASRVDAIAWFIAWPLTHGVLLMLPALQSYGGLSGVLHAGVVIVAVRLASGTVGPRRGIGAALLAGVALKLLLEEPWRATLQRNAELDIAVAPAAHVAGAMVGALCGLLALGFRRRSRP